MVKWARPTGKALVGEPPWKMERALIPEGIGAERIGGRLVPRSKRFEESRIEVMEADIQRSKVLQHNRSDLLEYISKLGTGLSRNTNDKTVYVFGSIFGN